MCGMLVRGTAVAWPKEPIVGDVGALVTAGVALLVAIGGYVQFVLRPSVFPCIEFDVDLVRMSHSATDLPVGELVLSIKNVGPGAGFVASVQSRIKYRLADEITAPVGAEPNFARSVPGDVPESKDFTRVLGQDAIALVPPSSRYFIQPGVTQWYRKPLTFPNDVNLIHVWAAFAYHIRVGSIAWLLASFFTQRPDSRIVTYSARRTFNIAILSTAPNLTCATRGFEVER